MSEMVAALGNLEATRAHCMWSCPDAPHIFYIHLRGLKSLGSPVGSVAPEKTFLTLKNCLGTSRARASPGSSGDAEEEHT